MTRMIENEALRLEISDDGAEPLSLLNKRNGREILWNGDATYWNRHAPILFPSVGAHYKNCYRHKGLRYDIKKHGFARDRSFDCIAEDEMVVTHRLVSDATTHTVYPFDFALEVTHKLEGDTLYVSWRVENTGNEPLYFTIGGHPGFALLEDLPDKNQYALKFPGKEALRYLQIDPSEGHPRPEAIHSMVLYNESFPLSEDFFANDARIFDGGQFEEVLLCKLDGTPLVGMTAPNFPNFGIWSSPGAPFVCLEPWIGRTDDVGFTGELSEKPGITALAEGAAFTAGYHIKVYA